MREASFKRFLSSLGSGTSVLDIPHPIVNVYTHRHTIENFEILKFFGFDCHHLRGMGFWSQLFVPLVTHTCACWVLKHVLALFEAFPNPKVFLEWRFASNFDFGDLPKKRVFRPSYPLWGSQNGILGPLDKAFWVTLETQICTKMAKKGF